MSDARVVPDLAERERALDPTRSFIVQAPAGSGKTELLIQRYLALLARVERPEEIAAITFTIKAAAEMRGRIFEALGAARGGERPPSPHEARTWDLARDVLERNDALGWKLEESADRLRVQTIDALCASLTRQMPVLSRFGAQPEAIEDASALYAEAARSLLACLEDESHEACPHIARLLLHVDNDAAEAEKLIADMLMRRDHWIRTLPDARNRQRLEAALVEARAAAAARVHALFPPGARKPAANDVAGWIGHAHGLLTTTGEWRKSAPAALSGDERLRVALRWLQLLPPPEYTDEQWQALETIVHLAPLATAELQYVFAMRGQADFVEIGQGALRALETEEGPTDLLLALDYRIRHILVDEFQDTSFTQYDLLKKLTSGWEPADQRTLFLVGDPMQSIYRFREAEVGLFLRAQREGIGSVALETLTLSANFRSQAGIVDWVNATFAQVMPEAEDIHSGAVRYAPSKAVHEAEERAVEVHPFFDGDAPGEAAAVARLATEALASGTVAILVRNRSHLREVLPRLREARLAYRAIEIETLGHRPVVQDLLALARALTHLADRTAWLGVLRAPWCGLVLADLLALSAHADTQTLWEAVNDGERLATLAPDGRARLAKVREVLGRALADRARSSLRLAVEGAWLALGGPACVENDTDLEDAEIFLDHLEASSEAGAPRDMADFESTLAELFALPDLAAPDRLQVMTIHKAKGLEFDTVIVPGLGSGTARDDRKLFMWMETPAESLLLAPINPTGQKGDAIYEFIRALDKEKADHETGRLLYVAATRAKRRLHLLGDTKRDPAGDVKPPAKGSLLAKIWPVVSGRFVPPAPAPRREPAPAVPVRSQGALRRLSSPALTFGIPAAADWDAPPEAPAYEPIEFSWVGDTARRVGSVVHRWLQRIAEDEARGWTRARIKRERAGIRRELVAQGVVEKDLDGAADRVIAALGNSLEDARGKWLLGPQRNARNEYRLSTFAGGMRRLLVIDRVFEDDVGDTWVVDYKTSGHEGGELEAFLAKEQERYHGQLERYVAALDTPGARRGLYFPLLKGWREWY
jgi:ATP-dependent helicase/nuclease subunit A